MTIGYGAPTNDIFYGGCSSMATLLTLEVRPCTPERPPKRTTALSLTRSLSLFRTTQSFAGIFLDSICIGMFYARFARANVRLTTL